MDSDTNSQRPRARFAPYVAVALLGFSLVLAVRSAPPGPRGARGRLIDLIAAEDRRSQQLRAQLDSLQADVRALEQAMSARTGGFKEIQASLNSLGGFAGTAAVRGAGLTVELRDSTLRSSPTGDPNDLVIHEQDIQAVVNALWAGGAEAMAVNGERITATTAVRCVGNTLLLHGVAYAPPYRVDAIGPANRMTRSLDADDLVSRFKIFSEEYRLGFDVRARSDVSIDGFAGTPGFVTASPLPAV